MYPDFLYRYRYIFLQVLKMSSDGFIVVDKQCVVTDINASYAAFLGKSADEIIGHSIYEIIPNSCMKAVVDTGFSDDLTLHKYEQGYIKNPNDDFVLVSRSPVRDKYGEIIAGVAHVHFRERSVNIARNMMHLYSELEFYKEQYENNLSDNKKTLIGASDIYLKQLKLAYKASHSDFPVLLTGETGTGKEVFAGTIHAQSQRARHPFVAINCAAIPEALVESELFGYEAGAFTGARSTGKKGKFLLANGGTLFLDEIGDMPLTTQAKLLRVLQEHEIDPVGSTESIPVDVRIITATRKNLEKMVQDQQFREDLYYRINVINIEVPALRKRTTDIPLLAVHFLEELNAKYHKKVVFHKDVMDRFIEYDWPGNIRELQNVVSSAYSSSDGLIINLVDVPQKIAKSSVKKSLPPQDRASTYANDEAIFRKYPQDMPLSKRLMLVEYTILKETYEEMHSIRKAAQKLGLSPSTFARKKKQYEEVFESLQDQ